MQRGWKIKAGVLEEPQASLPSNTKHVCVSAALWGSGLCGSSFCTPSMFFLAPGAC